MPDITVLQPFQAAEARRIIYTVAHELFNREETLADSIARYETSWPLPDVLDFRHAYVENGGAFLVICEAGRIIGTGALKRMEEGVGEIKRLWLLPQYHGQGLGYRMMMELLAIARVKGYKKIRLQTSPAYQQRAFEFYKRLGFYEIPRYGDDPDDVGMELELG